MTESNGSRTKRELYIIYLRWDEILHPQYSTLLFSFYCSYLFDRWRIFMVLSLFLLVFFRSSSSAFRRKINLWRFCGRQFNFFLGLSLLADSYRCTRSHTHAHSEIKICAARNKCEKNWMRSTNIKHPTNQYKLETKMSEQATVQSASLYSYRILLAVPSYCRCHCMYTTNDTPLWYHRVT